MLMLSLSSLHLPHHHHLLFSDHLSHTHLHKTTTFYIPNRCDLPTISQLPRISSTTSSNSYPTSRYILMIFFSFHPFELFLFYSLLPPSYYLFISLIGLVTITYSSFKFHNLSNMHNNAIWIILYLTEKYIIFMLYVMSFKRSKNYFL